MESRACSFSDNSTVSFDITMGVEGEEMAKPSQGNYLHTSTPFVRPKPPVSRKGGHTSLDTCEELDEQSCCAPQDMSLEASAINASSTAATTSSALLSETDSLAGDHSEDVVPGTSSTSEMNVAFWDSSLKGLIDSDSKLPESSTVSRAGRDPASWTGNEADSGRSVAGGDLAVDLTEQAMLDKSFTETEPSVGVGGRADDTASDGRETKSSETSQVASETSTDNPSGPTSAATEAAQVKDSASLQVTRSSSSSSIYLDDGTQERSQPPKKAKPPKRLTMAQRATMEAMAAFGGATFGSMQVRRIDLRTQLKEEARKRRQEEEREEGQPLAKRTRLQAAKLEAEETFHDVPIGGGVRRQQNGIGKEEGNQKPFPRRLTRVERARIEALQSFNGSSFNDTMDGSKRKVARTLEAKSKDEDTENGGSSEEGVGSEEKENSVLQA